MLVVGRHTWIWDVVGRPSWRHAHDGCLPGLPSPRFSFVYPNKCVDHFFCFSSSTKSLLVVPRGKGRWRSFGSVG